MDYNLPKDTIKEYSNIISARAQLVGLLDANGFADIPQPLDKIITSFLDGAKNQPEWLQDKSRKELCEVQNALSKVFSELSDEVVKGKIDKQRTKKVISDITSNIREKYETLQLAKIGEHKDVTPKDSSKESLKLKSGGLKSIIASVLPRRDDGEKELDKILGDKLSYIYTFHEDLKEDGFDIIAYSY